MAGSKDEFKWFGEGFDGFPRGLPDDCVDYSLSIIDSKLRQNEIRQKLRSVQTAASTLTKDLLKGYIWQRETFGLELLQEKGLSFLRGRTNYGDSVEDEWLIVYILRQISKDHPEIWIRIVDTDGQFLLIEAANKLPKWLNPEIAEHRVWLNRGRIFIIPPGVSSNEPRSIKSSAPNITLLEALEFLEKTHDQLLNMPQLEEEAFHRLAKYPQQIWNNLHHALVTIPRKLAYVLHEGEAYISPAIEAFYLRDPIALLPIQAAKTEKLIFSPEDLVTVSAKFTKVGYAQLKSQEFSAPKSWDKILAGNIEGASGARTEMGMKLACGFEMLMQDPQNKDKRQVREIRLLLEDIKTEQDHLPSNAEISGWRQTEDDEQWLDINFDDFEKELAGTKDPSTLPSDGFGDKGAQENLRRMVAKFQDFLGDDNAGPEGAENMDDMDDMDDDDDSESDEGASSDGRELDTALHDIEFKEDEFASMLKGLLDDSASQTKTKTQPLTSGPAKPDDVGTSDDSDTKGEEEKMRKEMFVMEQELRDAGALRLDPGDVPKENALQGRYLPGALEERGHQSVLSDCDDQTDEDLNIDMNLAKNLLASFAGQSGNAGPSGNLMGLMGMRIPRDEAGKPGDP